jgi:hypothetical protein
MEKSLQPKIAGEKKDDIQLSGDEPSFLFGPDLFHKYYLPKEVINILQTDDMGYAGISFRRPERFKDSKVKYRFCF